MDLLYIRISPPIGIENCTFEGDFEFDLSGRVANMQQATLCRLMTTLIELDGKVQVQAIKRSSTSIPEIDRLSVTVRSAYGAETAEKAALAVENAVNLLFPAIHARSVADGHGLVNRLRIVPGSEHLARLAMCWLRDWLRALVRDIQSVFDHRIRAELKALVSVVTERLAYFWQLFPEARG